MNKLKQTLVLLTSLISLLTLSSIAVASTEASKDNAAGFVIAVSGKLTAVDEKGKTRTLTRRSQFFASETLKTAANSTAQIRFKDNALMTLKPGTQLKIGEYHFGGSKDPENKSFMELLSGGFRTLSGSIGKLNQAAYRIDTPAASIGIRGTDYEIVIAVGGKVFAAVHGGGIALVNDIGELDIGEGSEFLYAEISPGQAPVGLESLPELFVKMGGGEGKALTKEEKEALAAKLEDLSESFDSTIPDTDGAFDFDKFIDSVIQSGVFDDIINEDPYGYGYGG